MESTIAIEGGVNCFGARNCLYSAVKKAQTTSGRKK
jgi:hypothetical protein